MKKALIVIPTYNEAENIVRLINEIFLLKVDGVDFDILVIDDNSKDGTSQLVKGMGNTRVFVIDREMKMGLGTAYIRGFKYAIDNNYEYVFEMDADFSHDPKYLPDFLAAIQTSDVVLGSRYVPGGGVKNWGLSPSGRRMNRSSSAERWPCTRTSAKQPQSRLTTRFAALSTRTMHG